MSLQVLELALGPLAHWYLQPEVEELAVNAPGTVWLRRRGRHANPWVKQSDSRLSRSYLTDICHIISNTFELSFDPDHGSPLVFAALPGDHRFSAICGRNVLFDHEDIQGGVALCVRQRAESVAFDLSDYGLERGRPLAPAVERATAEEFNDPFERLAESLKRGDHILVSGATATGKTTFLNNLLAMLDKHLRVITVEDARELVVPHENRVHVVLSRTEQTNSLTYKGVIDLIVRMTPDAIIGGEVSTSNAASLWELMGSGHSHCYATIHAETPEQAYEAFCDRILHGSPGLDRQRTIDQMRDRLRVVQLNRQGNIRAVTHVT